jgi:DNA-binding transcriptional MerR regulator
LSNAAIAQELEIGQTTVRRYRARSNGQAPVTDDNGHAEFKDRDLELLVDNHWRALPLLDRVKILLSRV